MLRHQPLAQSMLVVALVVVVFTARARAQALWTPNGLPVCVTGCSATRVGTKPDGFGGALLVWQRNPGLVDEKIYVQRVLQGGVIAAGWPSVGTLVVDDTHDQYWIDLCGDGSGGAYVLWQDYRNAATSFIDLYAQHVLANGQIAPGWPTSGVPVCLSPGEQSVGGLASDGSGGVYVVWQDGRVSSSDYDIYGLHLLADGTRVAGWPENGLPICQVPGSNQDAPYITPDGAGGFIVAWLDRRGTSFSDLYAQHMDGAGNIAPGWAVNGDRIAGGPSGGRALRGVASDGQGGAYFGWIWFPYDNGPTDVYATRVLGNGQLAPGWPADGVPLCALSGDQEMSDMAPDGSGGVFVAWDDGRDPSAHPEYALRLTANGGLATGWQANGNQVSNASGFLSAGTIAPDNQGGAYFVFESLTSGLGWIQRLTPTGSLAAGWPSAGLQLVSLPGPTEQQSVHTVSDGVGGAIVGWEDSRNGVQARAYAQRYIGDGPTAAAVSLASVDAGPSRVSLVWQRAGGASGGANVYRRTESVDWQSLGRADFDGSGRLSFVDASVTAGTRYAYRLGVIEDGAESFTDESWVDVPAALEFALDGLRPNPAIGELRASFSLARAGDARLALLDIAGRAVLTRDFSALAPGRHVLQFAPSGSVKPGVYWLRLSQANEARVQKAVVVR